jgi:hypothetical protein
LLRFAKTYKVWQFEAKAPPSQQKRIAPWRGARIHASRDHHVLVAACDSLHSTSFRLPPFQKQLEELRSTGRCRYQDGSSANAFSINAFAFGA